ncbi:MAG: cupin domain-containing protein [Tetrasphaera sp.]
MRGLLTGATHAQRAPLMSAIFLACYSYTGALLPNLIAGQLSHHVGTVAIAFGHGGLALLGTAIVLAFARDPGRRPDRVEPRPYRSTARRTTLMEKLPAKDTFKGPADWFTGDVYGSPIYSGTDPNRMTATLVRFTPGARTHWHRHPLGQCLHGTDGKGVVVARDGTVLVITAGETIWTPPEEEHWHGAVSGQMMAHLALLEVDDEGGSATWLEPVTDEEYAAAMAIAVAH